MENQDISYNIMLYLDYEGIKNMCLTNPRYYNLLNNKMFWKDKFTNYTFNNRIECLKMLSYQKQVGKILKIMHKQNISLRIFNDYIKNPFLKLPRELIGGIDNLAQCGILISIQNNIFVVALCSGTWTNYLKIKQYSDIENLLLLIHYWCPRINIEDDSGYFVNNIKWIERELGYCTDNKRKILQERLDILQE